MTDIEEKKLCMNHILLDETTDTNHHSFREPISNDSAKNNIEKQTKLHQRCSEMFASGSLGSSLFLLMAGAIGMSISLTSCIAASWTNWRTYSVIDGSTAGVLVFNLFG